MATAYPATLPFDRVSLVLAAVRGEAIDKSAAAKAVWELTGYGLNCAFGEPDGPQALREAQPPAVELSEAAAVQQLELLQSPPAEVPEGAEASVASGISYELAAFLLQWLARRLLAGDQAQ